MPRRRARLIFRRGRLAMEPGGPSTKEDCVFVALRCSVAGFRVMDDGCVWFVVVVVLLHFASTAGFAVDRVFDGQFAFYNPTEGGSSPSSSSARGGRDQISGYPRRCFSSFT